jgi:type IV pilus assembly protein PilV
VIRRCPTAGAPLYAQRGFTLVEVMVTVVILVLGLTALALFFGGTARCAAHTERLAAATELAQAKIEGLLQQTYTTMASGNDTVGPYRRTWTVSNSVASAAIAVTLQWTELGGHRRSVTVKTLRTD